MQFLGLNLSISVPFSPQLTRVEFRKYPRTRIRAIKTRRNKSNNCNAIYRNGEGEGRGKEVYGKIHSPGIRPYDLAISCRAINSICLPRYPLRTNHWYTYMWKIRHMLTCIKHTLTCNATTHFEYYEFHYFFLSISFFFFFLNIQTILCIKKKKKNIQTIKLVKIILNRKIAIWERNFFFYWFCNNI